MNKESEIKLKEYCMKDVLLTEKLNGTICLEGNRIFFMLHRDGLIETLEWAKRTKNIYRKALMNKNHHARLPQYRKSYIESYLALNKFIYNNTEEIL